MSDAERYQIILTVNKMETPLNNLKNKGLKTKGKGCAEHEYLKLVENIAPLNLVLMC